MASNKTIKTIKNSRMDTIYGSTSSFFTGTDDLINQNFDPYVSGFAFIYWTQLPSWFEKDPDLKYFKQMTQKNFMGFQGLNSVDLQTLQLNSGFAGNEYEVVGGVNKNNTEFTLTHKEFSGGIMRKLYSKWLFLMRDPRTGIALYPRLFNIEYGSRNHTGQLLYVVVRPDVTNTASSEGIVEFAAYYTNVFPKSIPLDHYNYTIGNQESNTLEINMAGNAEIGPSVEKYAEKILKEKILKVAEDGEGIPFVDIFGVNEDAISTVRDSTLTDILGQK